MALIDSPSPILYNLGGGLLTGAKYSGTTPPAAEYFIDLGNIVDVSFQGDVKTVEHKSTRAATIYIDDQRVTFTNYSFDFKLDEWSQFNIALLVQGRIVGNVIYGFQAVQDYWSFKLHTIHGSAYENQIWWFKKVKMIPAGATNLIDMEKYQEMPLKAQGLADQINYAASPLFDITCLQVGAS